MAVGLSYRPTLGHSQVRPSISLPSTQAPGSSLHPSHRLWSLLAGGFPHLQQRTVAWGLSSCQEQPRVFSGLHPKGRSWPSLVVCVGLRSIAQGGLRYYPQCSTELWKAWEGKACHPCLRMYPESRRELIHECFRIF